jgi:putative transcriptional regulator
VKTIVFEGTTAMVVHPTMRCPYFSAMVKRKQQAGAYNRIKNALEEAGRNQTWLAEQMDLDFETINRYCNNHRQPTIPTLFEIAKLLRVKPSRLLNE